MSWRRCSHGWTGTLWTLFVLVLVSSPSTLAQQSVGEVVSDTFITGKVKASLAADAQVSALAINVDTANGVVSLTGVVNNEQERQQAIQLAQGINGVKRVEAHNLYTKRASAGVAQEGEHAMRGTITAIDESTGILSLRTDAGDLKLHFPPPSVRELKEGDTITVHLAFEKGR